MSETYREAQGLKFSETKGACHLAYDAKDKQSYTFPDGKKWKVAELIEHFGTGFRAIILQPETAGHKTILAFAGTDFSSLTDILTDLSQAFGGLPPQYWLAVSTARRAKGQYGNLVLTGHSLGGGLAMYASLTTKTPATTINPAPLNSKHTLIGRLITKSSELRITNYICGSAGFGKGEIVTSLISPGFISGEKQYVAPVEGAGFLGKHKLANTGAGMDFPILIK